MPPHYQLIMLLLRAARLAEAAMEALEKGNAAANARLMAELSEVTAKARQLEERAKSL